jgi:predicted nucleic acid-binding protein
MQVITNTSPLRYLGLLGHIDLLQVLFRRVGVPQVVAEELHRRQTPEVVRVWMANPPEWLEVHVPLPQTLAS